MTTEQLVRVSDLENLHTILRECRAAKGLSIRAAAEEIGVGSSTVDGAEKYCDMKLSTAIKVVRWLEDELKVDTT